MKDEIKVILQTLEDSIYCNFDLHTQEKKKLLDYITNLQERFNALLEAHKICDELEQEKQNRIDKAIEYLKDNACYTDNNDFVDDLRYDCCKELLNILEGSDKE